MIRNKRTTELGRAPAVGDPLFLAEMAQFFMQTCSGQKPGREPARGGCRWRHVDIPAKLTGARHELCTWGQPTSHQTWCGR
jgi:hypothetical protein